MNTERHLPATDHLSIPELHELAWAIDADGLAPHEAQALDVAAHARSLGLATVLAEVLADPAAPTPVRERAFGKVVHAMAHAAASSSPDWALAN